MPIEFNPLDVLDMNYDMQVDASDLQSYELAHHGTYGIDDLDHDFVNDRFDNDLNNDSFIDQFQVDLNNNNMIDQFENNFGLTKMNYDINGDGNIDYIDTALAQNLYNI